MVDCVIVNNPGKNVLLFLWWSKIRDVILTVFLRITDFADGYSFFKSVTNLSVGRWFTMNLFFHFQDFPSRSNSMQLEKWWVDILPWTPWNSLRITMMTKFSAYYQIVCERDHASWAHSLLSTLESLRKWKLTLSFSISGRGQQRNEVRWDLWYHEFFFSSLNKVF